jgi:hypothetical protein
VKALLLAMLMIKREDPYVEFLVTQPPTFAKTDEPLEADH